MIGRARPGLPAAQPAELVHLHRRARLFTLYAIARRAAWTRAGRSTRPTARVYSNTQRRRHRRSASSSPGFSSILTGLNFIVTIHKMRAPGLTWFRLPLFVWSHYATSLIMILGTPVHRDHAAAGGRRARAAPRHLRPALGGDPVLFQHLFWFYSHPAVYIMILPAMGVISELVTACLAQADLRLRVRRLLQPGHRRARLPGLGPPHVRLRPVGRTRALVFSVLSFLVAIPSAIKVFNWTATLYKGSISLRDADALRARASSASSRSAA